MMFGQRPDVTVAQRQGSFLRFDGADYWDDVGVVRYRSRRDMFEFALELGAKDQGIHKWASIEKTLGRAKSTPHRRLRGSR